MTTQSTDGATDQASGPATGTAPSPVEIQALARRVFGREISLEEADTFKGRLPALARTVEVLAGWEPELLDWDMAAVHRQAVDSQDQS